jgi:multidrug efflux pump subunit AcrB
MAVQVRPPLHGAEHPAGATTIGGLIPLYVSGGEMWEPMAVVIMFGLLVSTVLTLLIVPTLYAVLFRVRSE